MKAKANKWINVLLGAILGMLGYGCDIFMCKYGSPSIDFVFEGEVSNIEEEPLEHIQMVLQRGWQGGEDKIYWEENGDTLYTDADGRAVKDYHYASPMYCYKVIANDTAGIYASDSINTLVNYSGDEGWDWSSDELKVHFILKRNE